MSIKANVVKGSLVTQIQASDPDAGSNGRITYSLYSEARLSLVDVLEVSMLCSHEQKHMNRSTSEVIKSV